MTSKSNLYRPAHQGHAGVVQTNKDRADAEFRDQLAKERDWDFFNYMNNTGRYDPHRSPGRFRGGAC